MKNSNLLNRLLSYSHEKQSPQRFGRYAVMLIMLLTLGVGQMWADPWVKLDVSTGSQGTKTVGDKLNGGSEWWFNYQTNGGWSTGTDIQVLIGTSTSSYSTADASWYADDDKKKKVHANIGSFTFDKSGIWYAVGKYKSGSTTAYTSGTSFTNNTSLSTSMSTSNSPYWTVNPPAVSSFSVARSGYLAGSGTSEDPYLVASGSTLTLTGSGSKAKSDANSSVNYQFGSDAYSTTATKNITVTSSGSIVVKARCINSSASLNGTETSAITIYYAPVSVKDISVYIYVGGHSEGEINSVEMNGCTPYVGTKALAAVKINNRSAGEPKFTLSGNWLVYTFTNVTKVSTITCARSGGNIFTGEITDNVYYTYEGTSLPGQCIQPANPTWGTAPASGAIGGSMTATVGGAPDGATTTWTSTNTSAATVNSSGDISYVAAGNTTIKARVQKAASGDYCELDYTLSQDISVTSGATVSATRTCPEYVSTAARQVSMHITFTGTSSGWVYCIKHGWDTGYEVQWVDASGSSADWTKEGGVGTGESSFIVELYDRAHGTLIASSSPVTVIGEISEFTNVVAGSNGSVSPSGQVWANTNHVHPTITATPNDHYHFVNWTSSNDTYTWVSDPSSASSTLYARASNYTITANFDGDQYTITYKDQGDVAFSGNHVDSPSAHPTTHTYGTATSLNSATKTGYTFNGWFTTPACTGVAVNSLGATAYSDDITLYAKWTANTYDVAFNANGGSGSMSNQDFTYDVAQSLTSNAYTRAGYTFGGWATSKANADAGTKAYNNSQSVSNLSSTDGATVTLWAIWTPRPYKIVYFAMPQGWTNVYAYAWKSSDDKKKNANWPGVQLNNSAAGTGSVIENGVTYYYYKYYTDGLAGDSEGNGTGNGNEPNNWNYLKFNNGSGGSEGSTETRRVNISTGHYYWINEAQGSTGTASAAVWYVKGSFPSHSWDTNYPISFASESRSGSVLVDGLTASTSYKFKIYLAKATGEWYKYTGGPDATYDADKDITSDIGTELTLRTYNNNDNIFTAATTSYRFSLDVTNTDHPVLVVSPGDDADYSATIAVNGHGSISQGTGSKTIHKYAPTSLTAVAEPGYRFTGWTVDDDHDDYVTFSPNASSSSVTVTGAAGASGATITANFSNEGFVYFDRSAVNGTWSGDKVYVTYFTSAALSWNDGDGKDGALIVCNWINSSVHNQEMTRIPNTNIYYFYTSTTPQGKILFTDKSHASDGTYRLYSMGAAVREDFNVGQDNMFVVENYNVKDKNKVGYCDGYWMKYNETTSGIELQVFDEGEHAIAGSPVTFTTTRAGDRQFEASITLSAATAYKFKVKSQCGTWYGNSGTMTNTNCTGWDFLDRVKSNCYFRSTGAGSYKFTLNCTNEGKLKVSLEFPLDVNDYRVVYQGKVKEGGSTTKHPSEFIRHLQAPVVASDTTRKDTISFYVREDWSLQLQKCSAVSPSVTWGDEGDAITKASLGITENGVYTFYVTQTNNGTTNTVTIEKGEEYTGDYYIRSSAAGGGWEAYQTTPDNKLVHSDFSKVHSGYDYYHCHYVSTGQNVKFCIANDYSTNITDTLDNDTYVTSYGNLPYECSVRFMYNNAKNTISRAYLNGSYDGTTEYLALYSKAGASTDSIKNIDDSAIDKAGGINHVKFQDMGNWVYQKDIKALPGTRVRLISNYRFSNTDHLQYFKGSAGDWDASTTEQLIGGTTSDWQKLRLVYDFKTNHLIGAWLVPDGDIQDGGLTINADVMIIRTDQGDAEQITFGDPKDKLDKVNVIYSTLHLTYNHIANKKKTDNTTDSTLTARSQREYYWVSFPYDVKIEDIFGSVGDFNNEWGIMYYDGKERAEKGYWSDSPSFWKYFKTTSETLKAFEGYVVGVDIDMVGQAVNKGKWVNGVRDVYLYFPSDTAKSIVNRDTTITIDQTGYECTIDRRTDKSVANVDKDRRIADSYWHCIGVPSFHNVSHTIKNNWVNPGTGRDVLIPNISDWTTPDVSYLYVWNPVTNSYTPEAATTFNFKAMYSYIVQYNRDTIKWSAVSAPEVPKAIAARKARMTENDNIEWRIDLLRGTESQDHAYIRMSNDDAVSAGFEFSYDLTKELNANKANIYTFADYVPVAGNVMPMSSTETTIVPVGVKIPANGLYTFTMPEGSNGVGIYLVDNIAGTRTNLGLTEYTVNLTAGKYDQRFFLEISPIAQAPTDIEQTGANVQKGVRKVMVDGVLYIVKDGVVFDAQGRKVE